MSNVIDLDSHRPLPKLYNILALCLVCEHRWIGSVSEKTHLFKLECPTCGMQDSFASFIPLDYMSEDCQ